MDGAIVVPSVRVMTPLLLMPFTAPEVAEVAKTWNAFSLGLMTMTVTFFAMSLMSVLM